MIAKDKYPWLQQQLLPYSQFKGYFLILYLSIDSTLESIAQLREEKIVRIVLSNLDMPTLGVSLFL